MDIALIFSGISLAVSISSLTVAIKSYNSSKKSLNLQNKVNEIELKLKEMELAEKEKPKTPCIEAEIKHISDMKYTIKIWNSGNSIARNIVVSWNNTKEITCLDENKMPFEFLEPQKDFELSVIILKSESCKLCITTEWEDSDGKKQKKEQWCDY